MKTYFFDLGDLDGPGGPNTIPKGGGLRPPPPFKVLSGALGAVQTQKSMISTLSTFMIILIRSCGDGGTAAMGSETICPDLHEGAGSLDRPHTSSATHSPSCALAPK